MMKVFEKYGKNISLTHLKSGVILTFVMQRKLLTGGMGN